MFYIVLYIVQLILVSSFHSKVSMRNLNSLLKSPFMVYDKNEKFKYESVAISGLVSKMNEFCNPFVFNNIFEKNVIGSIKALTDDIKFARKRIVSPKTVYSGLFDVMQFTQVEPGNIKSYENALIGSDAWIAYNVSMHEVNDFAKCAVDLKLKRVVFAVRMDTEIEQGSDFLFEDTISIFKGTDIDYTLIKYGKEDLTARPEAQFPYRIVRDALPLPKPSAKNMFQTLSVDDLLRVISEVVDIPKTFNSVYGIGPGTALDQEISIYMKSRGWPERVQVGLLVGDMLERIEKRVDEENNKTKTIVPAKLVSDAEVVTEEDKLSLPQEGKGNKYAGFFA